MDVFVDYYNIDSRDRDRGLPSIDRLIAEVLRRHIVHEKRLDIRLYGGWYEERTPTREAQELAIEIERQYPTVRWPGGTRGRSLIVNMSLAYSLKCDPGLHIWHTFRKKSAPRGIAFRDPVEIGCKLSDSCPFAEPVKALKAERCDREGCSVRSIDVLERRQQKMVDSMISADMFFNLQSNETSFALVSSDDDMWPAIRTALTVGVSVFHIRTMRRRDNDDYYLPSDPTKYHEMYLSRETIE